MPDNRSALLAILAEKSFRLGDFTLASGAKSDYYIDCRTTTLHAEGGRLCGLVLHELLRLNNIEAEAVGGLTMGADPLVSNVATASAYGGNSTDPTELRFVHGFLVRKAGKNPRHRPPASKVSSSPVPDVVIVDDVCTTGGSTITAMEATQAAGMNVIAVLCLVDRQQGVDARTSKPPSTGHPSSPSSPPPTSAPKNSGSSRATPARPFAPTADHPRRAFR